METRTLDGLRVFLPRLRFTSPVKFENYDVVAGKQAAERLLALLLDENNPCIVWWTD